MSTNKQDPNHKSHWHLLSYMVPTPGQWRPVSFYGSYSNKILTLPAQQALRQSHNIPEDAVLMSVSYIGFASKHTIAGTSDKPVATTVTDAYRQGLTAAQMSTPGADVKNPYLEFADVDADMAFKCGEWSNGYSEMLDVLQRAQEIALEEYSAPKTPAPVIET